MSTTQCSACNCTETPLWRKGPHCSVLCNACGVKLMRNPQLIRQKIKHHQSPTRGGLSPNSKKPDPSPVSVLQQEHVLEQTALIEGVPVVPILDPAPPPVQSVRRSSRPKHPIKEIDGFMNDELCKKKRHHSDAKTKKMDEYDAPVIHCEALMGLKALQIELLRDQLQIVKDLEDPRDDFVRTLTNLRSTLSRLRRESTSKTAYVNELLDTFKKKCLEYDEEITSQDTKMTVLRNRIQQLCNDAKINPQCILTIITPIECVR